MRYLFLAALVLFTVAQVRAEEPGIDRPYEEFYKQLAPAKAVDPNDDLRIAMCIEPAAKGDALPADLAFEIRDGENRTPIPFDAKHCFELPANAAWVEHHAVLHKNTSTKLRLRVDFTGRTPKSTQLSYAELTASVPVFKKLIASQGMLARMMMPTIKGLEIDFAPGTEQSLIVHAPDGDKRFTTNAKGEIHMPYDPALNSARVDLSAIPEAVGPDA